MNPEAMELKWAFVFRVGYFQNNIVGNLKPRNKLKYDHARHAWLILLPHGDIETNAYPYFSIVVFQIYSSDLILEFTVRERFWNIFKNQTEGSV